MVGSCERAPLPRSVVAVGREAKTARGQALGKRETARSTPVASHEITCCAFPLHLPSLIALMPPKMPPAPDGKIYSATYSNVSHVPFSSWCLEAFSYSMHTNLFAITS